MGYLRLVLYLQKRSSLWKTFDWCSAVIMIPEFFNENTLVRAKKYLMISADSNEHMNMKKHTGSKPLVLEAQPLQCKQPGRYLPDELS